jgi:hypothetical protein
MAVSARASAQIALSQLEAAAHELLRQSPRGLRTGEVAELLGIVSHVPARNSNWLTRCVLENLVCQGRVASAKQGNARIFKAL